MKSFDPSAMTPGEFYQVMTRIVSPRPIAFVSTLSSRGEGNLAPFSYHTLGGASPPSVLFCPMNDRHGEEKDTLRNIRETGEYVINAVTREMAERMNITSAPYPRGTNEFDEAGLTRVPSSRVRPPRVGESPIAMECRLFTIVPHGEGPLAGHYVIGEILLVHASEQVLHESGLPDPAKVGFIGKMGGDWYTATTPSTLFELPRPRVVPPPRP